MSLSWGTFGTLSLRITEKRKGSFSTSEKQIRVRPWEIMSVTLAMIAFVFTRICSLSHLLHRPSTRHLPYSGPPRWVGNSIIELCIHLDYIWIVLHHRKSAVGFLALGSSCNHYNTTTSPRALSSPGPRPSWAGQGRAAPEFVLQSWLQGMGSQSTLHAGFLCIRTPSPLPLSLS